MQQQLANASSSKQQRSQRSDSDSESVFTDDDEWAHPLPLRENIGKLQAKARLSIVPSDSLFIKIELSLLLFALRTSNCRLTTLLPSLTNRYYVSRITHQI